MYFMVLRDDTINQQLLIPLDLRDLIPKDHPCFFIKNVVDTMDFTEIHKKYEGKLVNQHIPEQCCLELH